MVFTPPRGRVAIPASVGHRVGQFGSASDKPPGQLLVIASVLFVGANISLKYGVTTATVPVVVLAPVWISAVAQSRWLQILMAAMTLAVGFGFLLGALSRTDHQVSTHQAIATATLIVTGLCAAGVLLWALGLVGMPIVCATYAAGLLIGRLAGSGWQANPWKYAIALPVVISGLAIAEWTGKTLASIAVLVAVAGVSAVSDYRSFLGFCLLTVLLIIWQAMSRSPQRRANRFAPLILVAALTFGLYRVVTTLLTGGYLGAQTQARTLTEINASGSLLVGGRPEWAATADLMEHRPSGYGLGVMPNAVDINIGDAALTRVNVNPDYGYEKYMFGGGFRLHAIVADLWVAAGWAGLLLAAIILVVLAHSFAIALAERRATPLHLLVTTLALWDFAFGPIYTNLRDITLALAIALFVVPTRPAGGYALGNARRAAGSESAG